MDSKAFAAAIARRTDSNPDDTAGLLSAFAAILRERGADLDSVAMPGFGNFVAMKKAERVMTDHATGRRMLMPPAITLEFVAASQLKKRIANE